MKIIIQTYRLLRKMGTNKAYSTLDIVAMTGVQRCAVLKRMHRLKDAGIVDCKPGQDGSLYWMVINMPPKPAEPKLYKEAKSIYEIEGNEPPTDEEDDLPG